MKIGAFIFATLVALCFGQDNIPQLAEKLGATTLLTFVKDAGLAADLSGPGPFTVFAPTNEAFAALPEEIVNKLKADKALLRKVLKFHVASGRAYSTDLSNDLLVQSLDERLKIRVNIYQTIKTVVTVDGAQVVLVNQNATNGVIHVIDTVMYPLPEGDLPQTLTMAKDKEFSTLVTALTQGELVGALSGSGPFTVFAPTNAAFAKLPPGALDNLLKNKTALVAVLKYHVVAATAYSAGLSTGKVPTLEGQSVSVEVSAGGVMVNNAKVIVADVPASNGVYHAIDSVLLPPAIKEYLFIY